MSAFSPSDPYAMPYSDERKPKADHAGLSPEREAENAYAYALLFAAVAGMGRDWRSGLRFFQANEDRVAEAVSVVLSALDHARSQLAAERELGRKEGIREAAEVAFGMSLYGDNSEDFDDACDKIKAAILSLLPSESTNV